MEKSSPRPSVVDVINKTKQRHENYKRNVSIAEAERQWGDALNGDIDPRRAQHRNQPAFSIIRSPRPPATNLSTPFPIVLYWTGPASNYFVVGNALSPTCFLYRESPMPTPMYQPTTATTIPMNMAVLRISAPQIAWGAS